MVQPSAFKNVNQENRSKNLNFADSFRPIYYFSRVFGLMPYSIIYDSNGDVQEPKVRTLDVLWFVISMCIYILMAVILYQEMNISNLNTSVYILLLGEFVLLMLTLIFGAQVIGMDMCNRFRIIDILKKINTFDKEARHFSRKVLLFDRLILDICSYRWNAWEFVSIMGKIINVPGSIAREYCY